MEKKLNKKRVKKNKKPKNVLVITTIYLICFSVIAGAFAYTRINKYEEGVLEVCATQQDAYVQLVLDQINLKSNRDDEQIINDILGTMNSSSNKYWTFSKNQSILFVKDVLGDYLKLTGIKVLPQLHIMSQRVPRNFLIIFRITELLMIS